MTKIIKFITLSAALTLSIEANTNYASYKVKKNDTLFEIALKHKTTLKKLRKANNIGKYQVLRIGETLKIPTEGCAVPKTPTHTIKKGETLSEIAERYDIKLSELKQLNHITNPRKIQQGTKLVVDSHYNNTNTLKENSLKKTKYTNNYTVQKGETLSEIARKTGTDLKQLKMANGLGSKNFIRYGTVLKIPNAVEGKDTKWATRTVRTVNNFKKHLPVEEKVIRLAKTKLGKKYVWGATGNKNTYDCSSFTQHVYKKIGINIPRTSRVQSKFGKFVKRNDLQKGDLIFFDTSKQKRGYVNHVGIYLGNNKFIHASSAKKKVVISKLEKNFYSARYKGARRLIKS